MGARWGGEYSNFKDRDHLQAKKEKQTTNFFTLDGVGFLFCFTFLRTFL